MPDKENVADVTTARERFARFVPKRIHDAVLSRDVWNWPEFLAFLGRLGLPTDMPTQDVTIKVLNQGFVEITYTALGADVIGHEAMDRRTLVHNEQPCSEFLCLPEKNPHHYELREVPDER